MSVIKTFEMPRTNQDKVKEFEDAIVQIFTFNNFMFLIKLSTIVVWRSWMDEINKTIMFVTEINQTLKRGLEWICQSL